MPITLREVGKMQMSDSAMSSLIATVIQVKWLPEEVQKGLEPYEWDNGILWYEGKAVVSGDYDFCN